MSIGLGINNGNFHIKLVMFLLHYTVDAVGCKEKASIG